MVALVGLTYICITSAFKDLYTLKDS